MLRLPPRIAIDTADGMDPSTNFMGYSLDACMVAFPGSKPSG